MAKRALIVLFCAAILSISPCLSDDRAHLYERDVLEAEIERYNRLIEALYRNDFQPHLTPDKRIQLDPVEYRLPMPRHDDNLMDFAVTYQQGRPVVELPVASLKLLEDLATAFAWMWSSGYRFDTIDLYLAMLRYKPAHGLPGGRYPAPLQALGVPQDVLEDGRIDEMSLRLRNSGLAFVLAQALGQIVTSQTVTGQGKTGPSTMRQIRAEKMEADRFALNLLERADIIPMGMVIYFHARVFGPPHRNQLAPNAFWGGHPATTSSDPPTVSRLAAMAQTFLDQGARETRPASQESFRSLADRLMWIAAIVEDDEVQRCLAKVAQSSSLDALAPAPAVVNDQSMRWCR